MRYNCCVCDKSFEELGTFENHLSSHTKFQGNKVTFNARVGLKNADDSDERDNDMDTSDDIPFELNLVLENANVQLDTESAKKENVVSNKISSPMLYSCVEEGYTSKNKETKIAVSPNSITIESDSLRPDVNDESSRDGNNSGDYNIDSVKQIQDEDRKGYINKENADVKCDEQT